MRRGRPQTTSSSLRTAQQAAPLTDERSIMSGARATYSRTRGASQRIESAGGSWCGARWPDRDRRRGRGGAARSSPSVFSTTSARASAQAPLSTLQCPPTPLHARRRRLQRRAKPSATPPGRRAGSDTSLTAPAGGAACSSSTTRRATRDAGRVSSAADRRELRPTAMLGTSPEGRTAPTRSGPFIDDEVFSSAARKRLLHDRLAGHHGT